MERYKRLPESEPVMEADILVAALMEKKLPSYYDCPASIDLSGHRLAKLLKNVRRTADIKMIEMIKKVRRSADVRGLSIKEIRKQTDDFWWIEYYQSVYNHKYKWYETEVRQGDVASSNIQGKRLGDPHNSLRRIFIHTHPSDSTFSSPDLHHFFLGMDSVRILGYEDPIAYAGITLQCVITDDHIYLAFPTQETEVPGFAESLADGLISAEFMKELMPTEFERVWLNLILKYGYEKLEPFIGNKLYSHDSFFPEEVNDLGTNLINLAHTLEICRKYALKIYVADRDSFNFRVIDDVEDVYRDILV